MSTTEVQTFVINHTRDTTIYGKLGTQILFQASTLCEKEQVRSQMTVELKEYYSKGDMLLGGLTTTSNDSLLESKGMIHLAISLNDQPIESLCKPLSIRFPSQGINQDYQLFNGVILDNQIDWIPAQSQNYHIYVNWILNGEPPINSDIATINPKIDSVPWNKGFSQRDTIFTFTASDDTLTSWNDVTGVDSLASLGIDEQEGNTTFNLVSQVFQTTQLGWINCDRFLELSNLTSFSIKPNMDNVYSYVIFEDINAILLNYGLVVPNIPIGQDVIILSLKESNGEYFLGIKERVKVEEGLNVKMILKKLDKQTFQTEIKKALK